MQLNLENNLGEKILSFESSESAIHLSNYTQLVLGLIPTDVIFDMYMTPTWFKQLDS